MRVNKKKREKSKAEIQKQFDLALQISKIADQSFMSGSQLSEILQLLCASSGKVLDFFNEDKKVAIFAITQLMEFIRRLPMKFFSAIENRTHALEAMQIQLDELIVAEEQEENEEAANMIDEDDEEEEDLSCTADNVVKNA